MSPQQSASEAQQPRTTQQLRSPSAAMPLSPQMTDAMSLLRHCAVAVQTPPTGSSRPAPRRRRVGRRAGTATSAPPTRPRRITRRGRPPAARRANASNERSSTSTLLGSCSGQSSETPSRPPRHTPADDPTPPRPPTRIARTPAPSPTDRRLPLPSSRKPGPSAAAHRPLPLGPPPPASGSLADAARHLGHRKSPTSAAAVRLPATDSRRRSPRTAARTTRARPAAGGYRPGRDGPA